MQRPAAGACLVSSNCFCADIGMFLCVCLPPRLLITSGMIWTPYDWLNKFYSCYMAAVVVIDDGHGLTAEARHINLPNKSMLYLYKPLLFTLIFLLNSCTQATRQSTSVIKVGVVCLSRHLKEELAWAIDKRL